MVDNRKVCMKKANDKLYVINNESIDNFYLKDSLSLCDAYCNFSVLPKPNKTFLYAEKSSISAKTILSIRQKIFLFALILTFALLKYSSTSFIWDCAYITNIIFTFKYIFLVTKSLNLIRSGI